MIGFRRSRFSNLFASLILVLLLVGCSGSDSTGTAEAILDDRAVADVAQDAPATAGDPATAGESDVSTEPAPRPIRRHAPTGQHVIRTAELLLRSSDTAELLHRVRAVAERVGGYTATSDLQRDEQGTVSGTVTLRVPTDELNEVVDDLEALGDEVPVNRIDERDVSTDHADIEARISNLTAYEQQLTALMADIRERTDRPEDLLTIFERIRSVREEIDVLQGRLTALEDQIAFATVTVTLEPLDDPVLLAGEAEPWAPATTLREALAATVRVLTFMGDALIWMVVTGIPVLIGFLGIPAFVAWLVVRWSRQRPRTKTTSPEPPST